MQYFAGAGASLGAHWFKRTWISPLPPFSVSVGPFVGCLVTSTSNQPPIPSESSGWSNVPVPHLFAPPPNWTVTPRWVILSTAPSYAVPGKPVRVPVMFR